MTQYSSELVAKCKNLLNITPPSKVWEMEHGNECERKCIADLRRYTEVE